MLKIIRTSLLLGIICFISAFCLAQVFRQTKDKIAGQSRADNFLKKIFLEGERFDEGKIGKQPYFLAFGADENLIGVIIPVSAAGYGGKIKMLVGLDLDGTVSNFQILEQNETPGLGAKILEPVFLGQFKGKNKDELGLIKDEPSQGKIEAVTSATISSRAVTKGFKEAVIFFEENLKEKLRKNE